MIARRALAAADQVVATARRLANPDELFLKARERLMSVALDVTDQASIGVAVEQALERFGRLDVLGNNAGYGRLGTFEEVGDDTLARQFATNVVGAFDVTRAILPAMRAAIGPHRQHRFDRGSGRL